jgi:hypothetical protein
MFANNIIESLDAGIVDNIESEEQSRPIVIFQRQSRQLMSSRSGTWQTVKNSWNDMVDYAIPHFWDDPETKKKKDDINKTLDNLGDYSEEVTKNAIDISSEYAKRWAKCHLDPYIAPAIIGSHMWMAKKITQFAIKTTTTAVKTWINTRSDDVINKDFDPNAVRKYWKDEGVPDDVVDNGPTDLKDMFDPEKGGDVEDLVDYLIEKGKMKNPCPKSATWTTITL